MNRLKSIDTLRGLVMIIMALDHTRDLFHLASQQMNPTDLTKTTVAIFFTRWITHFCAPIFVFLAGTSIFLQLQKSTDKKSVSKFLFTRGLWLVFLELTIVNFAFWFDIQFHTFLLQVIYAIGFSMILLSALIYLPYTVLFFIGIVLVAGHNLLDSITIEQEGPLKVVWSLLFQSGMFRGTNRVLIVGYPVLPWLGVMLLGFATGKLFLLSEQGRKKKLLILGFSGIALFVLLRFSNLYGDPAAWAFQLDTPFTFLSFINTTKYPPSLLYVLMTLSPALLLLYFFENKQNKIIDVITVYGKVPMFYYLLHWYFIHTLSFVFVLLAGYSFSEMPFGPMSFGVPEDVGLNLPGTYAVWALVVISLYPLCKWYSTYKQQHALTKKWLRYL